MSYNSSSFIFILKYSYNWNIFVRMSENENSRIGLWRFLAWAPTSIHSKSETWGLPITPKNLAVKVRNAKTLQQAYVNHKICAKMVYLLKNSIFVLAFPRLLKAMILHDWEKIGSAVIKHNSKFDYRLTLIIDLAFSV